MNILLKIDNNAMIRDIIYINDVFINQLKEDEEYIENIDENLLIKIQPNLTRYENGQFDFSNNNEVLYIEKIRIYRKQYCFDIVNRGQLWYDTLTSEQKEELKTWYQAWLDAPETLIVPDKPEWLQGVDN